MTYTDTEIYNGDSTVITIRIFINKLEEIENKWVDITRKNAKDTIAKNAIKKI